MTDRLSEEREEKIRNRNRLGSPSEVHVQELLRELSAVRAERDEAKALEAVALQHIQELTEDRMAWIDGLTDARVFAFNEATDARLFDGREEYCQGFRAALRDLATDDQRVSE